MTTAFTSIPILDFSAANDNDAVARRKLADEVREACLTVGFFYIKNHGVDQRIVDNAFERAHDFFALPVDQKAKIDHEKLGTVAGGWTRLMGENVDPANRGDLHESFDISASGDNVFPEGLPGFERDTMAYWHAVIALGSRMMRIFALALDLPENYFDDKTEKSSSILRYNWYPPQGGVVDDRVLGIDEHPVTSPDARPHLTLALPARSHTDYELMTCLAQDDVGGLQVLNRDHQWVDATPVPGTFVVNIADQLMRWTNDRFVSTRHRAINRSGRERISIPLFFGSNADCIVEPMPTCISADNPAKYPPVAAGKYVEERLRATYAEYNANAVPAAA